MTELGGSLLAESGGPIEVCGSPGEVSSDPNLGHQYYLQKSGDADEELPDALDQDHYRWHSNKVSDCAQWSQPTLRSGPWVLIVKPTDECILTWL